MSENGDMRYRFRHSRSEAFLDVPFERIEKFLNQEGDGSYFGYNWSMYRDTDGDCLVNHVLMDDFIGTRRVAEHFTEDEMWLNHVQMSLKGSKEPRDRRYSGETIDNILEKLGADFDDMVILTDKSLEREKDTYIAIMGKNFYLGLQPFESWRSPSEEEVEDGEFFWGLASVNNITMSDGREYDFDSKKIIKRVDRIIRDVIKDHLNKSSVSFVRFKETLDPREVIKECLGVEGTFYMPWII